MYKCSYCNQEYETPIERSRCETKCYEKEQQKIEAEKKALSNKEKAEDRKQIENLIRQRDGLNKQIEAASNAYYEKHKALYRPDLKFFADYIFDSFIR